MNVDVALMELWNLGMDDAGWTDECFAGAEALIPTLADAGYVSTDDRIDAWRFTPEGVSRAKTIEAQAAIDPPKRRRLGVIPAYSRTQVLIRRAPGRWNCLTSAWWLGTL